MNLICGNCHLPASPDEKSICKRCENERIIDSMLQRQLYIPPWLKFAFSQLSVAEIPGELSNDKIADYLSVIGMPRIDEIPWCAAFVAWCLKQSNTNYLKSALSRDWLSWGQESGNVMGCIAILWRGDIKATTGHIGFYIGEDEKNLYLLGGNQSNSVSIAPYSFNNLLGFRMPKED